MAEDRSLPPLPDEIDVAVVGAGLAGLCAARELSARGARVLVLEARGRVGGRTLSRPLGRGVFDLGGQWVGASQQRVRALASELGVPTFPTYSQGKKLLERDGKITRHRRSIASLPILKVLELQGAVRRLERLARSVPPRNPAAAKRAGRLDRISVEGWKREAIRSRAVQEMLDCAVRAVFGAEPAELSLLYFLFYVRAAGSLRRLLEIKEGAQQDRFVPGAQELARRMAAGLDGAVALEAPVHRIAQGGDRVTLESARGAVHARYALVAVPPALAARIAYEPAMPASRDQLTQRQPMGSMVKCVVTYERPFWRERGLSGEVVSTSGPVTAVFDNSSHDNAQPALVALVSARAARRFHEQPVDGRRRVLTSSLMRWFGEEAAHPSGLEMKDWADAEYSRGCPVGVIPPGALTSFGPALRRPVGRIHWAGTETATSWCGYMEGALESGERAARELLERL